MEWKIYRSLTNHADAKTEQETERVAALLFDASANQVRQILVDIAQLQPQAEQEADLKDWITGQNSDGLGEGFEQQEINIESYSSSGRICVSFWHSGDDYFVDNEDEFAERLEQGFNLGGM